MKLQRPSIVKKKKNFMGVTRAFMGTRSRFYIDTQNAYFGGNHAATHVHDEIE
jgi:hypothetical protein